jgi:hypothetical protein
VYWKSRIEAAQTASQTAAPAVPTVNNTTAPQNLKQPPVLTKSPSGIDPVPELKKATSVMNTHTAIAPPVKKASSMVINGVVPTTLDPITSESSMAEVAASQQQTNT